MPLLVSDCNQRVIKRELKRICVSYELILFSLLFFLSCRRCFSSLLLLFIFSFYIFDEIDVHNNRLEWIRSLSCVLCCQQKFNLLSKENILLLKANACCCSEWQWKCSSASVSTRLSLFSIMPEASSNQKKCFSSLNQSGADLTSLRCNKKFGDRIYRTLLTKEKRLVRVTTTSRWIIIHSA